MICAEFHQTGPDRIRVQSISAILASDSGEENLTFTRNKPRAGLVSCLGGDGTGHPPADGLPGKGGGKEGMAERIGKTDTYIMHANNLLY